MGGHKELVLEFPGVYALVSSVYHLFGAEHSTARAVLLLFFIGGTLYLYKMVRFVCNQNVARATVLIYLAMPLSLYYSRAIQIDFSAIFFVLGLAYHFARGYTEKRLIHIAFGSTFAVLAFLTKVPYVVPVVLPLAYLVFKTNDWKFVTKTVGFVLFPLICFGLWWQHGLNVNGAAPDWDFIPTYRKFTNSSHWYFGAFSQRLEIKNWEVIFDRLRSEVLGWSGIALLALSFFSRNRGFTFFLLWLVGTLVYLLIFFNLNVIHNYYQIPFLIPLAVFAAKGLMWLYELVSAKNSLAGKLVVPIVLIGIGTWNFSYAESHYYHTENYLELIGGKIEKNTEQEDLVIISFGKMDPRCPLLLYRARRNGWSIPHKDLSPTLIYKLMEEGANQLAIVSSRAPGGQGKTFTDFFPQRSFALAGRDSLFLYQLDFKYLPPKPE